MKFFICTALLLLLLLIFPSISFAKEEYIGSRPFQSLIRQDLAEQAAIVFVQNHALEQSMRGLAKNSDLQFALEPGEALSSRELAGLTKMLYKIDLVKKGVETHPPEIHSFVHISIERKEKWRNLLQQTLQNRELAKLYGRIYEQQKDLLIAYDATADEIFELPKGLPTGRILGISLQNIVTRMKGLQQFEELLTGYDVKWEDPKAVYDILKKILANDAYNPLYLTALAEVLLQLDRPAEAQIQSGEATKLAPDYPKAHDIHGTILLRQRLPALATKAFSEAIALSPNEPRYRLHRAAAFLVQEEAEAMCQDLRIACTFGQCEQYAWARETGKCPPENGGLPLEENLQGQDAEKVVDSIKE